MGSTIRVKAKLFGTLRKHVPEYDHSKGADVFLDEGSTIEDLVAALRLPENEARLFFIKGLSKRYGDRLHDSDEVGIFMQMSGG
jgi:molybdopterin converting factor small subunit